MFGHFVLFLEVLVLMHVGPTHHIQHKTAFNGVGWIHTVHFHANMERRQSHARAVLNRLDGLEAALSAAV